MAHKIGVIGDKYSVMPFKLFGFDVRYGMSARQIRDSIEEMAEEDYGVIFITEQASEQVTETIDRSLIFPIRRNMSTRKISWAVILIHIIKVFQTSNLNYINSSSEHYILRHSV